MDIIEIILTNYTDFNKFEDLANEIMIQEGYNNLIPAGGIKDGGVDAGLVKYYEQSEYNIIFQYSLQQNVKSKISSTYNRIKETGKKCDELIIVTLERVNNKEEVKTNFRKKHGIRPKLEIYERQVFKSRLGANPSFLNRYFPDIRKQLNSDLFSKQESTDDKNQNYEKSLAKISIALTQSDAFFDSNKKIFDTLILYFVYSNPGCDAPILQDEIKNQIQAAINRRKIECSLTRQAKLGNLIEKNGGFYISDKKSMAIEEASAKTLSEKSALFDDIIFKIQLILERDLSNSSKRQIVKNSEEGITDYFKLYALEKSFDIENIHNDYDTSMSLISKLKQGLPEEESEVLIYCVGEILKSPTIDQEATLISWCKTYVGAQVLKLDPKQNNFQGKQFAEKEFIIDTDFVLNLIVSENTECSVYRRIISELIKYNAKIIIPIQVLHEVSQHAKYSYRNYNYFRTKSDVIDPIILEEQVGNIFAKGYFNGILNNKISPNFDNYIQNYYHPKQPIEYFIDLIKNEICSKIIFIELADLELEENEYYYFEQLQERVFELTKNTFKGSYRDEEENREIAKIDSRMYMNYLHENRKENRKAIDTLKYKYYVLTTSSRVLKCAKELGIFEPFYIRPLNIISLIERVAPFDLSYDEIKNLFENPFLSFVVTQNWESIEKLVGIGVDLRGYNLTRLKYELADVFTSKLFESNGKYEENAEDDLRSKNELMESFIETSKELENKGYKFIPSVKALIDNYQDMYAENQEKEDRLKEMEKQIELFGKRKQKYLKRMAKKIKS